MRVLPVKRYEIQQMINNNTDLVTIDTLNGSSEEIAWQFYDMYIAEGKENLILIEITEVELRREKTEIK